MPLTVADPNIQPRRHSPFWFRVLEIVPGACVWIALLTPFLLAFSHPFAVTLFILVFDVYWLVQSFNYSYFLIRGFRRLKHNMAVDWHSRLVSISELDESEREKRNLLNWE